MRFTCLLLCLILVAAANAEWVKQASAGTVQFRGLSAVNAKVCWAAGSNGTFGRTVDGKSWTFAQVPGAEKLIFRGVVGFDAQRATLLAIGEGEASRIYHTVDGGHSWALQFKNPDPKAFYDGISFWDEHHGIALSDPVGGHFRLLVSADGGKHWAPHDGPASIEGEGAFAASNTCLVTKGKQDVWFASGGATQRRLFRSRDGGKTWSVVATDPARAIASAGTFGLAFRTVKEGIAVGGDYKEPNKGTGQIALTHDGGKTWTVPKSTPTGLRECAVFLGDQLLVVGPGGTNLAGLDGTKWESVSPDVKGLHVCSFAGGAGWAAGDAGLIVKWRR
jgi:photosystem II stability/assembly factor-like uncharacterized protein